MANCFMHRDPNISTDIASISEYAETHELPTSSLHFDCLVDSPPRRSVDDPSGHCVRASSHCTCPRPAGIRAGSGRPADPQQNQLFEDAKAAHRAHRYSDALASFKLLLGQLPGAPILSKYASNTAINAGDVTFALNTVKPVAQADPNDRQAAALLTRACAESGDTSCRDSGIAHMLELHSRGITPSGMQDYVVEEVKVGENTLQIWASLEPWGYYKVYDTGRAMDKAGNLYHDTVRQEFISVVNGKTAPISSRSNLVVPQ
jgi:predicted Zn-dependent protease